MTLHCVELHDQARQCSACVSPRLPLPLTQSSGNIIPVKCINEGEGLTGLIENFLIWYSAEGTHEVSVILNFDPLVSLVFLLSGQYCTHFSCTDRDLPH